MCEQREGRRELGPRSTCEKEQTWPFDSSKQAHRSAIGEGREVTVNYRKMC